jgi:hypothetical protein
MGFAMLPNLGESKFNTLQDELALGKPPLALARTIRSQWGDCQDSSDTQLAMQLTRLRKQIALGKVGKQMHVTIEANRKPDIRALKSPNLDAFQELVALTKMHLCASGTSFPMGFSCVATCIGCSMVVTLRFDPADRRVVVSKRIHEEFENGKDTTGSNDSRCGNPVI